MDRKNLTTVNITYSILHLADVFFETSAWVLYIIGYIQHLGAALYMSSTGLIVMIITALIYILLKVTRYVPILFAFISEIVYKFTGYKNSEIPLIFNIISQLLNIPLQGIIVTWILIFPIFGNEIMFMMAFNMLLSIFDLIIFVFNLEEIIREETTRE